MAELLRFNKVSFEVNNQKILHNINFTINQGELVSISGPSGSGKSTILKLISHLISSTTGQIIYHNQAIETLPYAAYRRDVSYCFQSPQLFGETVRDNFVFPAQIRDEELNEEQAINLLAEMQLNYIDLDKEINSLSGGEKQRIALIRNLLYPPKVLLLDEITASLDNETSQVIWHWLLEQAKKHDVTLIWVSHKQAEIEMANHFMTINQGKISSDKRSE